MVSRNLLSFMDDETLENRLAAAAASGGKRKSWDDEFVLKRQFSALIPAFDPRPGRVNVNQTSDLDIPAPGSLSDAAFSASGLISNSSSSFIQPALNLSIRGPHLTPIPPLAGSATSAVTPTSTVTAITAVTTPGCAEVEIPLLNSDWTIFRVVQELMQASNLNKQDKTRKIWEPTFTIVYKEQAKAGIDEEDEDDGGKSTPIIHSGPTPNTLSPSSPAVLADTPTNTTQCSVDDVLRLLSQLNAINVNRPTTIVEEDPNDDTALGADLFMSKKITNKLQQQIQDPLVLSSNSLPTWCEDLNQSCPFLFPFETRQLYFNCTAFGASRSIVWLQSQRDVTLERQRMPGLSPRRDEQHEFRVGRLKHERVKVARNEQLLEWAMQVMKVHANRKSVLEVEFLGEEGTGLGPTLEFYALVSAELQRADLAMWLYDDEEAQNGEELDLGEGRKPIGFYVRRPTGLFPAPLPQHSDTCDRVSQYFWFLGVFLAKVLQDGRLVDLPLSDSFLQLLCHNKTLNHCRSAPTLVKSSTNDPMSSSVMSEESDMADLAKMLARDFSDDCTTWYDGVLGADNLQEIDPIRAEFLRSLQDVVLAKQMLEQRLDLSVDERRRHINELRLHTKAGPVAIEDLALTFTYLPSSKFYGYEAAELLQDGTNLDVTIDNLEEYCELTTNFCLQDGIGKQLEAFHDGFSQVFPLNKLAAFSPDEARMMICGEQHPAWTREDLMAYTDPKLGYTKER